jgi:hypothetical protein
LLQNAPGREDAPGQDTGASTGGFMHSPDDRERALNAMRIGSLLMQRWYP